jgi:hypothetical protein
MLTVRVDACGQGTDALRIGTRFPLNCQVQALQKRSLAHRSQNIMRDLRPRELVAGSSFQVIRSASQAVRIESLFRASETSPAALRSNIGDPASVISCDQYEV